MKTSRFACLSVLLPLMAGAATISDVSFRQDRATRVVTVNYTLSNGGSPAYVTMEVLDGDGIAIASANLNIKTATGDISQIDGHAVPDDGEMKTITWPVMDDWPDHLMTNASVRISAHSVDNPPPKLEYIYIDLSGGPDAASYPVVATFDVPDPTDITCVSNRLWMRRIEAGTFKQGSPSTEAGRNSNRESQHQVTLTKPFFAGVFEVTRAQYRLVMGSDPGNGSSLTCPGRLFFREDPREDGDVLQPADGRAVGVRLPRGHDHALQRGDERDGCAEQHCLVQRERVEQGASGRPEDAERLGPLRHARQRV